MLARGKLCILIKSDFCARKRQVNRLVYSRLLRLYAKRNYMLLPSKMSAPDFIVIRLSPIDTIHLLGDLRLISAEIATN